MLLGEAKRFNRREKTDPITNDQSPAFAGQLPSLWL
jgi:hypothetical protein